MHELNLHDCDDIILYYQPLLHNALVYTAVERMQVPLILSIVALPEITGEHILEFWCTVCIMFITACVAKPFPILL